MKTSEQTNEIAKALSIAQGKMKKASKDAKGFNYLYTKLEDYFDACRDVLAEHGLCVIQFPAYDCVNVTVTVTTRIEHTSGQFYASDLQMPVSKKDAKEIGSAITYARKYGLSSMLGIVGSEQDVDEDKDKTKAAEEAKRKEAEESKKIGKNNHQPNNNNHQIADTAKKYTVEEVLELIEYAKTGTQIRQVPIIAKQSLNEKEIERILPSYESKFKIIREEENKGKPA